MSDIHVSRAHHLSLAQAKAAVQEAADDLAAEYGLHSHWKGNTLHFERSGVEGSMKVSANAVELDVKLGFLLRAFRSSFEGHIERHLDQHLGERARLAVRDKPAAKTKPSAKTQAAAKAKSAAKSSRRG